MKLTKINLLNFRNCGNININLGDRMNIFIGNNAQGKTNLLESIYYCCIGKSFKSCKDKELVKWGEENGFIKLKTGRRF